jgi:hypothetical protein
MKNIFMIYLPIIGVSLFTGCTQVVTAPISIAGVAVSTTIDVVGAAGSAAVDVVTSDDDEEEE